MCVLAWAWAIHRQYPLIVLANRDEYHRRPTLPVHWWPDHPELLAGRDLEALGTWMGVTRSGRFAAVANRPGCVPPSAPSRGHLVSNGLLCRESSRTLMQRIDGVASRYAGFNLIIYDGTDFCYCSNRQASQVLSPGVYGMANREFCDGSSRVRHLTAALENWAQSGENDPRWAAWEALLTDTLPADNEHPESSIFVVGPCYGTRASQVVAFDRFGGITVIERRFNTAARQVGKEKTHFRLD